jgi:excisionase family DNA binding protein
MIYRLIRDCKVESIRVGRCRRVVRTSFDTYLKTLIESARR